MTTSITHGHLKQLIERIERLEEDKQAVMEDIKSVYGEAKSMGFDVKAMRKIVAMRKQDQSEREEAEAVLNTYMAALGMIPEDAI